MTKVSSSRVHGLDVLRSLAIILVFMYHYVCFVTHQPTFGFLSDIGWVGVDLFFVLSGYLIGHQMFLSLANHENFSLKVFYMRRLLRTLPNYLFILSVYFCMPGFREQALISPLWKFLTFTQNFGLHTGTAFSHAWSLCVEEQFYLILPLFSLMFIHKKSIYYAWITLLGLICAGIILRGSLWIYYTQFMNNNSHDFYYTTIYYCSFCRLDELIFGVAIAMLRDFHRDIWIKITGKGNLILLFGVIGSCVTSYLFLHYRYSLFMIAFGYPLLGVSFGALTLAALCQNSYLHKVKIPGAATLAVWSYAIYLIHKPLSVIICAQFSKFGIEPSNIFVILIVIVASVAGGGAMYTCIETPFLRLRDRIGKKSFNSSANYHVVKNEVY